MNVIIAGTDGSDRSASAVEWAADEAAYRDHTLHIVHSIPWLYGTPIDPRSGIATEDEIARGQKVLDAAVSKAHEQAPGVRIDSELMAGSAAQILLDRGRGATMIVVGAHGSGLLARLPLGSTALQVVTHSTVPVVVVREPEPVASHEITVGVDATEAAGPALRFAFEEAAVRKARLCAVHTWAHPSSIGPSDMRPLIYDPIIVTDQERQQLGESLATWREEFPDVEVRCEVVHGRPVRILAGASTRSDLLVVGTRGRGGFPGLRLGSVSHAMLHCAHCPVAVVPPMFQQEKS
jgi:nucleotide-binding universal stress UspA family protein